MRFVTWLFAVAALALTPVPALADACWNGAAIDQTALGLQDQADHFYDTVRHLRGYTHLTTPTNDVADTAYALHAQVDNGADCDALRFLFADVEDKWDYLSRQFRRAHDAARDPGADVDWGTLKSSFDALTVEINRELPPPPPPPPPPPTNRVLSVRSPGNGWDGDLDMCLNVRTGVVSGYQLSSWRDSIVNILFDVETTNGPLPRIQQVSQAPFVWQLPGDWSWVRDARPVVTSWSRQSSGNPPAINYYNNGDLRCVRLVDGCCGRPGAVVFALDWNVVP